MTIDWICGGLLIVLAFIQYYLCSFDPIDSDLIIYEQSVYIASAYSLP